MRALCDELLLQVCDEPSQNSYARAVDGLMSMRGPEAAIEQLRHLRTRLSDAGIGGEEDDRDLMLLDHAIRNFHEQTN